MDVSLLDMVITTAGVLTTMVMLSCICCLCMKFSDMKMKSYIIEMAKERGIKVDPDSLDLRHGTQPRQQSDNCTIMIPDVGIIL